MAALEDHLAELGGQLVGAHEIAERAGVRRIQVVHAWRRRHGDFPAPLAELRMGLVWFWPEVERWLRATGRAEPFR